MSLLWSIVYLKCLRVLFRNSHFTLHRSPSMHIPINLTSFLRKPLSCIAFHSRILLAFFHYLFHSEYLVNIRVVLSEIDIPQLFQLCIFWFFLPGCLQWLYRRYSGASHFIAFRRYSLKIHLVEGIEEINLFILLFCFKFMTVNHSETTLR